MTSYQGLSQGSVAELGNKYQSLEYGGQYFRPDQDVKHFSANWNGKHPLVFQIIPDIELGQAKPSHVLHEGALQPTDFFMKMPEASIGSAEKVTFLLFDPFAERRGAYSAAMNPYIYLRNKIRRLANGSKDFDHFKGLLMGGKDTGAPLAAMRDRYFFNAIVWADANGSLLDEDRRPAGMQQDEQYLPIVSGTNSFGRTILAQLQKQIAEGGEDYLTGDAPYYMLAYNGKACSLQDFLSPEDVQANLNQLQEQQAKALQGGGTDVMEVDASDDDGQFSRYTVSILSSARIKTRKVENQKQKIQILNKLPASSLVKAVAKRYRRVKDLIVIPSEDEQVALIARAFADKPHVLKYGFAETNWLNNPAVRRVFDNRQGLAMGAGGLSDHADPGIGSLAAAAGIDHTEEEVSDEVLSDLFGDLPGGGEDVQPARAGNGDAHGAARSAMRG